MGRVEKNEESASASELAEDTVYLYTEKKTSWVYEAKLYDDHVVIRPASPSMYNLIQRIPLMKFVDEFEEFCGNRDVVKIFIQQAKSGMLILN